MTPRCSLNAASTRPPCSTLRLAAAIAALHSGVANADAVGEAAAAILGDADLVPSRSIWLASTHTSISATTTATAINVGVNHGRTRRGGRSSRSAAATLPRPLAALSAWPFSASPTERLGGGGAGGIFGGADAPGEDELSTGSSVAATGGGCSLKSAAGAAARARPRAMANCPQLLYRSSGLLARALPTTGSAAARSARAVAIRGGAWLRCAHSSAAWSSRTNGADPVRHW